MHEVKNINEALEFFLNNSNGSCLCIAGDTKKQADSYLDALAFFNQHKKS